MTIRPKFRIIVALAAVLLASLACVTTRPTAVNPGDSENPDVVNVGNANTVQYTVRTQMGGDPAMAFVGVGGPIDGVVNPQLEAEVGDTVEITVINGDPVLHDLTIDEFGVTTGQLTEVEEEVTIRFEATSPGEFTYYCSIPGHLQAGMAGSLLITGDVTVGDQAALNDSIVNIGNMNQEPEPGAAHENAESIIRHPADLPDPIGDRDAETIRIDMEAVEVVGQLDDGTTFRYMTFDGKVPGPMLRVREGDTIELHLTNKIDSLLPHNIDLHAVTGPGGGAVYTATQAGEETVFTFKALQPGVYVYHCATASIGHHISSGMYGLIVVEPEGGLPEVDHEFYVMQGEIYTAQSFGTEGHLDFSHEKMLDEDAEYLVFNGAANALTLEEYQLEAEVGDTVRIFFGVGGPNYTSSFHVIGEIFDRVYDEASLTSEPLTDVQTTLVPPGGATVVEFDLEVPGQYILVDHALARLERGLVGFLNVTGEDNPEIFHGEGLGEETGH